VGAAADPGFIVGRMRWLLGLTTIGLLAGAGLAWSAEDSGLAGILARVGVVLAAIWLAYPAVVDIDRRAIWLLALAVIVVILRPRAAVVVLPVIALFARTSKDRRRRADR
jgi:hypothetical protein